MIKNMMSRSIKTKSIFISLFAAILLLITIVPGPAVFCEYRLMKPEWKMPKHYPQEGFHGWGLIDYFNGNDIVINDLSFKVSSYATFHTPDHPTASRYEFTPGKEAGFLFNDNGEIISLWMITKKK